MNLSARRAAAIRTDTGLTLIETLISILILSVAGVAILTGLQLSEKTSDIHRKQSTGGAYVRSYAEAIQKWVATGTAGHYVTCSSVTGGAGGSYAPATVGFTEPSGYKASYALPGDADATVRLTALDGDGSALPCASDKGVQRVTLTVRSLDNRATEQLTIVLRRPCGSGSSCS